MKPQHRMHKKANMTVVALLPSVMWHKLNQYYLCCFAQSSHGKFMMARSTMKTPAWNE
jgi:hypothetical protein